MVNTSPPHWWGLEEALDDPVNLHAAFDLAVAFLKNYELDLADSIYEYAVPFQPEKNTF